MAARWTFMVYMAGNNTLSDAASDDLAEMRKVGSSADVQVLAFVAQRRLRGGAQRLKIEKDGHGEQVETLDRADSGDPQTVVDFVRWGLAKAPAEKYALILWNHGGGWEPDDLSQLYSQVRMARGERVATRDIDVLREMTHRAAQPLARTFFRTSVEKILSLPTERERMICSDDASGHSLDTIELGRVVGLAKREIGHEVDVLGMDACLMSTLEVAYQLKDTARIVVGSEQTEPGAGWDYATLLGDLAAEPSMDAAQLGRRAVGRYIESYKTMMNQWPVTQCAVETARVDGLCVAVDALEQALRPELGANWSKVLSAQRASVMLNSRFRLVDLASFCQSLASSSLDSTVQRAALAVLEALRPGGYVVAEGHLGRQVEGCAGVSVYMPGPMDEVSTYYKDLAFAEEHRWGQFLQEYHDAV